MQQQFDRVFTRVCWIVLAVCAVGILIHAVDVALLPAAAPVATKPGPTPKPAAAVNCHSTWPPTDWRWSGSRR